jgi:serine/threonine protein kinase
MPIATVDSLVEALHQVPLLEPAQLSEVTTVLSTQYPLPRDLAGQLVQRGWLTPYQANQLFQGRAARLVLGPYVLLERLGAGGMGEVFKARDRRLGRLVALKAIRKEHLANEAAVRRFYREIQVAARLDHPNIVLALDADRVGDTHFFVMEYVDGIDLHRLVQQQGPLPVPRACDCIRQAALGLQHAHEQGLVHRDVKPHNLLYARADGRVKILDLGLARLATPGEEASATLTQQGAVMGTPDYIAPEQAMDAHRADIRADLYSLGGTFYYLLTGQPPFSGRSVLEKLWKHQCQPPPRLEDARPEAPPAVAAIMARLLAKRPEERYQTPTEVAIDLAVVLGGSRPELPLPPVAVAPPPPAQHAADSSTPFNFQDITQPDTRAPRRRKPVQSVPWMPIALLALSVMLVLAFLLALLK